MSKEIMNRRDLMTGIAASMVTILFTPRIARACTLATACEEAQRAARSAPYRGPLKPATEPMACIRVVTYNHSEVIWVNGTQHNFVNAPVIYRQGRGAGYSETFALDGRLTVVESCIPRRLLQGVSNLTVCNGDVPGSGFHWELHANSLNGLTQTGHVGTYLPLLKEADRRNLSPNDVREVYRARYLS